MSWGLATLGLLGLVLAGGFAWYERSRPPARMIALVAALAALAVAGRLALAAIPDVVATTDIVLITGLALGAGPGFAVGALAALVSNLWLGQGPWTPWEMAGWGMAGLGGAALGRLAGPGIGRLPLAIACAVAGFAYGALLDLSVMVTYGGEQSLARYLALSARGLPFNVAHAAGNFAIALAAGPALARMIARCRARFEHRWLEAPGAASPARGAAAALLVLAVASAALAAAPAPARAGVGQQARAWLERQMNGDGGFGASPGDRSSPAMTGWAMLGLEAAGRNPLDLGRGGANPVAYLRASAGRLRSTGDLERTILALAGAGVSVRRFGGHDLVAELEARRDRDGSFDGQVNLTAFGILALEAAHAGRAAPSAHWLERQQNRDGGWGFAPDAPSDADSTGAALQGLAAAGGARGALAAGVRFLRRTQDRDGGFALSESAESNSQSTAWAVQGLVAAGVNPAGVRARGRSPLDYMAARQAADGHFEYSAASDQTPVWVTGQVLMAVERRALPLAPVPRAPRRGAGAGEAARRAASARPAPPAGAPGPKRSPAAEGGSRARKARGAGAGRGRALAAAAREARASSGRPAALATAPAERGGTPSAAYVLGGLAALAALLGAGYVAYRRRILR